MERSTTVAVSFTHALAPSVTAVICLVSSYGLLHGFIFIIGTTIYYRRGYQRVIWNFLTRGDPSSVFPFVRYPSGHRISTVFFRSIFITLCDVFSWRDLGRNSVGTFEGGCSFLSRHPWFHAILWFISLVSSFFRETPLSADVVPDSRPPYGSITL